jgi:hypothetical protein
MPHPAATDCVKIFPLHDPAVQYGKSPPVPPTVCTPVHAALALHLHMPLVHVSADALHAGPEPHLQVPAMHVSAEPRHGGLAPHKHCPLVHVSVDPEHAGPEPHLQTPLAHVSPTGHWMLLHGSPAGSRRTQLVVFSRNQCLCLRP